MCCLCTCVAERELRCRKFYVSQVGGRGPINYPHGKSRKFARQSNPPAHLFRLPANRHFTLICCNLPNFQNGRAGAIRQPLPRTSPAAPHLILTARAFPGETIFLTVSPMSTFIVVILGAFWLRFGRISGVHITFLYKKKCNTMQRKPTTTFL